MGSEPAFNHGVAVQMISKGAALGLAQNSLSPSHQASPYLPSSSHATTNSLSFIESTTIC